MNDVLKMLLTEYLDNSHEWKYYWLKGAYRYKGPKPEGQWLWVKLTPTEMQIYRGQSLFTHSYLNRVESSDFVMHEMELYYERVKGKKDGARRRKRRERCAGNDPD